MYCLRFLAVMGLIGSVISTVANPITTLENYFLSSYDQEYCWSFTFSVHCFYGFLFTVYCLPSREVNKWPKSQCFCSDKVLLSKDSFVCTEIRFFLMLFSDQHLNANFICFRRWSTVKYPKCCFSWYFKIQCFVCF